MEHEVLESKATKTSTKKDAEAPGQEQTQPITSVQRILQLHRKIGNRSTGRLIQTKLKLTHPDDPYERESDNVMHNQSISPLGKTAVAVARQPLPREQQELAKFAAGTYKGDLSLGEAGYFRAEYAPSKTATLTISVPIHFEFLDSVEEKLVPEDPIPTDRPARLISVKENKNWTLAEKKDWQEKFIKAVEGKWSSKQTGHTLYCHRAGWEMLVADVIVKVDVMGEEIPAAIRPFFAKVYRGESRGCGTPEDSCVNRGRAVLRYPDLEKGASVAAHEFGHMLGLGDEYEASEPIHSGWVKAEFGYGTQRLRESIMKEGGVAGKVLPEHGVVFLEAMRRITGVPEWHLRPKSVRR